MSGAPGMELFGPWEEGEDVRAALVEAGADFGLRQVGSRVYATNTLESGWIPCPLPAIFTGDELKSYREWLPANGYEATGSLGGSFYSDDISDYYLTPWDLGYGPFVKFDHDFIGREALEELAESPPRRKVTLAWNGEDVARAMGSLFAKGDAAKYIDLPLSNYSTWPNDKVLHGDDMIGVSTFSGYSYNERSMLSLAVVDADVEYGAEVDARLGRGERRLGEAGGRAARAVRDPRDRQPVPVLGGRPHDVRRGLEDRYIGSVSPGTEPGASAIQTPSPSRSTATGATSRSPALRHLLGEDEHRDERHPEEAHHPDREQHHHQPGAAADAVARVAKPRLHRCRRRDRSPRGTGAGTSASAP